MRKCVRCGSTTRKRNTVRLCSDYPKQILIMCKTCLFEIMENGNGGDGVELLL
jgi:NMD protein affecting ribosome stability and mRNA decay